MTPMKARKAHMPAVLRRSLAVVAIGALLVGGIKISAEPDASLGTFGLPGATADPTGPMPTGGGMGPGGMNGGQFVPPNQPPSMPDYQGGINQPPLNQDSGVSIYNTGSPGAQQVSPQQPQQGQQPGQRAAHGDPMPNYETATPFTQGPGKPNPNYQPPQQTTPQQGQQPQQQPSQAPTQTQQPEQPQNKQDDITQQLNERQQQCQAVAQSFGNPAEEVLNEVASEIPDVLSSMLPNGGLPRQGGPSRSWSKEPFPVPVPSGGCNGQCPPPEVKAQWGVIRTDQVNGFKSQINSLDDMKSVARELEDSKSDLLSKCQWAGYLLAVVTVPVGLLGRLVLGSAGFGCGTIDSTISNMVTQMNRAKDDGKCGIMEFHWDFWFRFTPQRCLF